MPLFTRRQLQNWLDELSPVLSGPKANDFVARIEDKAPEQALPAEMELAVLWAIAKLGNMEIEPKKYSPSGKTPEAISKVLIPGVETVIEVTAPSDSSLPGEAGMRKASNVIINAANGIRRRAGQSLRFFYRESRTYTNGKLDRKIKVPKTLIMTPTINQSLRDWLNDPSLAEGSILDICEAELDVQLTWHKQAQVGNVYRSSMPAEVHNITKNYLFESLKRKASQLRNDDFLGIRCLIICDAGSTLLRKIDNRAHMETSVSGEKIIKNFLHQENAGLDIVVVVSPRRRARGNILSHER